MNDKTIDKPAQQAKPTPCDCRYDDTFDRIEYCAKHEAASELLEACKDALAQLRHIQLELENDPNAMPWPEADKLDMVIAKAEGRQ